MKKPIFHLGEILMVKGDFRPLGLQRKLKKLEEKIKTMQTKYNEMRKNEYAKALKKSGQVNTLVAGWGAC